MSDAIIPAPETGLSDPNPPIITKPRRGLKVTFPGHIKLASSTGYYPGCKAKWFANAEEFNAWAEAEPTHLVVNLSFSSTGTLIALYSKVLSDEEQQLMEEFNRDYETWKGEREAKLEAEAAKVRAELEAQRKKEEDERAEKAKRIKELISKGEHCEKHHSNLKKGKK